VPKHEGDTFVTTQQALRASLIDFLSAQIKAGRALSDLALSMIGLSAAEIAVVRARSSR